MMNWHSLDEFLHMGGYGLYVWGAYGVTLLVMAAEAVSARRRHTRAARAVAAAEGALPAQATP